MGPYAGKGNHYGKRPREGIRDGVSIAIGPVGRTFSLRGWQRRRLVPLHHTERESQEIVAGVLPTQNHLFTSPPRFAEEADDTKPSPAAGIDVNASTNWVHTGLTKSSGPNS